MGIDSIRKDLAEDMSDGDIIELLGLDTDTDEDVSFEWDEDIFTNFDKKSIEQLSNKRLKREKISLFTYLDKYPQSRNSIWAKFDLIEFDEEFFLSYMISQYDELETSPISRIQGNVRRAIGHLKNIVGSRRDNQQVESRIQQELERPQTDPSSAKDVLALLIPHASKSKLLSRAVLNQIARLHSTEEGKQTLIAILQALTDASLSENKQRKALAKLLQQLQKGGLQVSAQERKAIISAIRDDLEGYGPLSQLLRDEEVHDIYVNAPDTIFVSIKDNLTLSQVVFDDTEHLMRVLNRLVFDMGLAIDEESAVIQGKLPDGTMASIILPPVAVKYPAITLQKMNVIGTNPLDYMLLGVVSESMDEFLCACIKSRLNIAVIGGFASDRESLISILSQHIPSKERILAVETSLSIPEFQKQHRVTLTRSQIHEDVIPLALSMQFDRVITGELSEDEASLILDALHHGNVEGILTVLPGKDATSALDILETMYRRSHPSDTVSSVLEKIASSFDLIIHIERLRDRSRRVMHVIEVCKLEKGAIQLETIFEFEEVGYESGRVTGYFHATGTIPSFMKRIEKAGFRVPLAIFTEHTRRASGDPYDSWYSQRNSS